MNKRMFLLLLMISIFIYETSNGNVFANSTGKRKPPESLCREEFEKQSKKFDDKVLKNIVESYNLDLSGFQEFTNRELDLKVGDNINNHSDKISLQHLFVGGSIGSMRLFLENGLEGTKGYFLYKRVDGNNVLKELNKMGKVWVVMTVDEKKADKLQTKPFNWDKCAD
ncbi:hypothetical protein ACQKJG_30845 [Priestia megaterium]|uniref:hypothetical protein n=1 Tax=Priestia megaterium TaxID=1404 RepID=UPI002D7FBF07|nr:hypothetical protein [Priestia megaterium]MEB4861320.1 hypothetical protein [Priestia megaterium]